MRRIVLISAVFVLISCSTDYKGTEPEGSLPEINLNDSSETYVNSFVRVEWSAEIGNEPDLRYYYTYTTDTTVTAENALDSIESDRWILTRDNFADISFPVVAYNCDEIFYKDSVHQDTSGTDTVLRYAYSKFFVLGMNSAGTVSPVAEKLYLRTNNAPELDDVSSEALEILETNPVRLTWYEKMILPESHQYSVPVDFSWTAKDSDSDAVLEYRWELWESCSLKGVPLSVSEWSNESFTIINDEIYNHNPNGEYIIKIFVRDDALQEAENHISVKFRVFSPSFNRGILLIDDNDPTLYPPTGITNGNPDPKDPLEMYKSFLEYSGYKPEGEALDSLLLYTIRTFGEKTESIGWDYVSWDHDSDPDTPDMTDSSEVYVPVPHPKLSELCSYRLVIIASDDRSNTNGIDWNGERTSFDGYHTFVSKYLNAGGKIFILGPSVLMGKFYESPDQLPINEYLGPFTQIFDADAVSVSYLKDPVKELFRDYFGIYAMTFPEQKTYFFDNSTTQLCPDHYLTDNYDFIGVSTINGAGDFPEKIRIDSARVNMVWKDRQAGSTIQRFQRLALKNNGSVFTGVPTFKVDKGESIYKYVSVYDIEPKDENYSYEISGNDTLRHFLWNWNYATGEIHEDENGPVPVLERSGVLASRYAEEDNRFKTAFFALPTYFLDDSENKVRDMFRAMIEWFDLSSDPDGNR